MGSEVEEIKSRLSIVDVLGEYIKLDKAGASYKAACPFHNEKSPSFMVSEEKQIWHCFGCQKGGDIFAFVMEMEGLEFRDALKLLAEKAGVPLKQFSVKRTQEKNRASDILELATKWYEHQLWAGPGKLKILGYLRERGLTDAVVKEFRLGYAPEGWRNILTFLSGRGYSPAEIAKAGLLVEKNRDTAGGPIRAEANFYDRFRQRIMFPIADYSGKIIGYSARVAPGADETQAKYVNTPETEIYHKSRVLYGIDKAKNEMKRRDFVLLVEGNMDVIAANLAGIKNTVAISGTALTSDQVAIIRRYTKNIRMFFDMDAAGQNATKKSVKLCLSQDMSVKVVSLPQGKDAADVVRDDPKNLIKAVDRALPVMEYFFKKVFSQYDKSVVEDKKQIGAEILEMIASLENDVEKSHWIKKLADELDIAESALTNALKKISLKSKIGEKLDDKVHQPLASKTKYEVLLDEMLGLMMVSPKVWEEAVGKAKNGGVFPEDSLLNLMLQAGEKLNYDFNALTRTLAAERAILDRAEKIFFEKKYRLGLNNDLEEVSLGDALKNFNACFLEISKEEKRKILNRIAADLKVAERKKDRNAIIFLREEFNRISSELAKLIN